MWETFPETSGPVCVHDEELKIPGDAPAFAQLIKLSDSQDTLPFPKEDCSSNGVRVKAMPCRLITGPKPGHSAAAFGNCTRIFGFLSENSGFWILFTYFYPD